MPKIDQEESTPESLRPYIFHGMEFKINGGEAMAECPFCGNRKFSVNIESSKFKCWSGSCGVRGNSASFLKDLWELALSSTRNEDFTPLIEENKFLGIDGLKQFGLAMSPLRGQWLVPGYNYERKLTGLYRYCRIKIGEEWKNKLLPTPGFGHHLFNLNNFEDQKPIVDICEGWKDGISWWEHVNQIKHSGLPMLADRNVIAVPGTNSFKPEWAHFFSGKIVNILFDNDYPGINAKTKQELKAAGVEGVKRVASMLLSHHKPPAEVRYIAWNGEEQGYSKALPDGMDIRDYLNSDLA